MSKKNNNTGSSKVCSKCKKLLPYSEFFKDKHNKKYGLSGYCKTCKVAYQKGLRNKNKPADKVDSPKNNREVIEDQIIQGATKGFKKKG